MPLLNFEPLKEVNFSKIIYPNLAFVLNVQLSNKVKPLYVISLKLNLSENFESINSDKELKSQSLISAFLIITL